MHPAAGHHPPISARLPEITTERLRLREFRATDTEPLAAVFAKREVWEFPHGRGFTFEETETFIANQRAHWEACNFGLWVAVERSTDRAIGYVGLAVPMFLPEILPAVEVGWRFDPDVWGRGYASEAARAGLHQAFTTLGLPEVCSVPQVENTASVRVAERIGMRRDRVATIPANERRGAVQGLLFWMTVDEWRDTLARDDPQ